MCLIYIIPGYVLLELPILFTSVYYVIEYIASLKLVI